jgi:hypothetical protein
MTIAETITNADLDSLLESHKGNQLFAQALQQLDSNEDVIRLLGSYIQFNSVFGGGVASLAGQIAVQQDIFRDPDEADPIADRSNEVAAEIFFAAIDEFGGLASTNRKTHRMLAQATFKAARNFYGLDLPELAEYLSSTTRRVLDGYGVNQTLSDEKLFRAIGFHIGSEVLASEEFRLLDGFLRERHPDLVEYLKKNKVGVNGAKLNSYFWIVIHTTVEADHFNAGLIGANKAIWYYAGPESKSRVKRWIMDGLEEFASMQTDFMRHLLEG